MNLLTEKPGMVREARGAKFLPNGFVQVLLFFAVLLVTQFAEALPLAVISAATLLKGAAAGEVSLTLSNIDRIIPNETLIELYLTALALLLTIVYVRFIERRSFYSMGFGRRKALRKYLAGALAGTVLFSAAAGLLLLSGTFYRARLSSFPFFLLFLPGFAVQGASEELLLRGYLMNSLAARHNVPAAVAVSSCLFGALHLLNPHVTALSVLNIVLFGAFAAFYALFTDSLWGACALHGMWNFFEGSFFGFPVSGLGEGDSLLAASVKGPAWFTGGSFGPEGGVAVTLVLAAATVFLFAAARRRPAPSETEPPAQTAG